MGCWNATCGLTQLPITSGVKAKLFILQPSFHKTLTTTCYSDDYFRPVLPPLTGYYDDYGGIESVEHDDALQLTIDWLQADWEGESIWDYLIALEKCEVEESMMLVIDDVYAYITSKAKRKDTKAVILEIQKSYKDWQGKEFNSLRDSVVSDYIASRLRLKGYSTEFQKQLVEVLSNTEINKLDYWIDFLLFKGYMSRVRKLWMPQTGAGSQSEDWDAHWLLTTATRNHIVLEKNKHKLEELSYSDD